MSKYFRKNKGGLDLVCGKELIATMNDMLKTSFAENLIDSHNLKLDDLKITVLYNNNMDGYCSVDIMNQFEIVEFDSFVGTKHATCCIPSSKSTRELLDGSDIVYIIGIDMDEAAFKFVSENTKNGIVVLINSNATDPMHVKHSYHNVFEFNCAEKVSSVVLCWAFMKFVDQLNACGHCDAETSPEEITIQCTPIIKMISDYTLGDPDSDAAANFGLATLDLKKRSLSKLWKDVVAYKVECVILGNVSNFDSVEMMINHSQKIDDICKTGLDIISNLGLTCEDIQRMYAEKQNR